MLEAAFKQVLGGHPRDRRVIGFDPGDLGLMVAYSVNADSRAGGLRSRSPVGRPRPFNMQSSVKKNTATPIAR